MIELQAKQQHPAEEESEAAALERPLRGGAIEWQSLQLSVTYALAMGVCGVVLVALGGTLSELAGKLGLSPEQVGSVFILRGIGAVGGSLLSATLYQHYAGNLVLSCSLLLLALGLGTAITDTGCQILTRKLHGDLAGPYLGLNTVAFGVSGSLVPIIAFFFADIYTRFSILTLLIVGVLLSTLTSPDPSNLHPNSEMCLPGLSPHREKFSHHNSEGTWSIHSPRQISKSPQMVVGDQQLSNRASGEKSAILSHSHQSGESPPHYHVEMAVSASVFCLIGGKVTVTAYLEAYVAQTGIIPLGDEHKILLLFWICVTIGRIIGIQQQRFFTDTTLPIHLFVAALCGTVTGISLYSFPNSSLVFWVCIPLYGLCNGPILAYEYDLNNRLTVPTELSTSVVMLGLNAGASIVPYISSLFWKNVCGPQILLFVIVLSCALPIPLLFLATSLSYSKPSMSYSLLQQSYQSVVERI